MSNPSGAPNREDARGSGTLQHAMGVAPPHHSSVPALSILVLLMVAALGCIILACVPIPSLPENVRLTWAWACADGLLIWGLVLSTGRSVRQQLLSPLGFQAVGYTLFFCVPAVYIVGNPQWDTSGLSGEFPRVLQALAVGFVFETAGYYSRVGKSLADAIRTYVRLPVWSPAQSSRLTGLWIVYGTAWAARAVLFFNNSYFWAAPSEFSHGPLYQLVGQVDTLGRLVLVFLCIRQFDPAHRRKSAKALVFVCLLELLWYLPAGKRQPIAELGVSIFLAWVLMGRRVRWTFAIPAALMTASLFSVISWYRAPLIAAFSQGMKIDATVMNLAVSGGVDTIRDQTASQLLTVATGELMYRLSDITSAAAPFRYTPSILDFQHGGTYIGALFFPIPRVIWPGKPSLVVGAFTTPYYFPWMAGEATRPITLLGECYLNFGYWGIPAVMFLWGLYLRTLYEYCRSHSGNSRAGLAFYIFISAYLIWTSPPFADEFELATRIWLFVAFAVLCMRVASRARQSPSTHGGENAPLQRVPQ